MTPLWIGVQYGLFLSLLVGPLWIALLQAGVERGIRGGVAVGLGIWFSDLLFILSVYFFFSQWRDIVEWPLFTVTVGAVGSFILIMTGVFSLWKNTPHFQVNQITATTYISLWSKGFLLNTVNPFTVFFWLFMMTSIVLPNAYTLRQSITFFSSLLGTIIMTDMIKVVLSKGIRSHLDEQRMFWVHKASASALIFFGVILLTRSLWE
jgi:threonine/homoserine/homoserine lactone efflux protein